MSTNIYTAYRIRQPDQLWPVLRTIKERGMEETQRSIIHFAQSVLHLVNSQSPEYDQWYTNFRRNGKVPPSKADEDARMYLTLTRFKKEYREQAGTSERNEYDFDVSVSIREYDGNFYLIPKCDWSVGRALDFLETLPELEDFSYWNSSDKPEHISRTEWTHRRNIWHALFKMGWDHYVQLTICSVDTYLQLDPLFHPLVPGLTGLTPAR